MEYDKEGHEVYRLPRLIVLGENEDGTIKIRDNHGVRDISKDVFEDYKLGKVSDTLSNPTAKYYLEHLNTVFIHRGYKDKNGEPRRGRLEYDPKDNSLSFVFKTEKGKVKKVEISEYHTTAQKGFEHPMVEAIGELTANQIQAKEAFEANKNKQALERRNKRLKILSDLYTELNEKQKEFSQLIEKKKNQLHNITTDLETLREDIESEEAVDKRTKKVFKFKSQAKKYLEVATQLSRTKQQLEDEIDELELQNGDIESAMAYVQDMSQNIEEIGVEGMEDFLEELREQYSDLKALHTKTEDKIATVRTLIKEIGETISSAISSLHDLISQFEEKYLKAPRLMGQEWVDFLQSKTDFLQYEPNYSDDLKTTDEIISQVEDFVIAPNKEKIAKLLERSKLLEQQLIKVDEELRAKWVVLDKFEQIKKAYDEQKKQEAFLAKQESLIKDALGTAYSGISTFRSSDENYEHEAKKANEYIPVSTIGIIEDKEYQFRTNRFGFRLSKFENRKKIRGIRVTKNNEESVQLKGFIDFIVEQASVAIDPDKVIALVMVEEDSDGQIRLVDEYGKPLTDLSDFKNQIIFQVYPLETRESMFRDDGTPKEVKAEITKRFAAWREKTLAEKEIDGVHEIGASLGFPDFEKKLDENGEVVVNKTTKKPVINWNIRNSVEDSGLIKESDLDSKLLISIPTTNENHSKGTTSFKTPLGMVFLELENGYERLMNRKHTKEEALSIYDVIVQLCKQMIDPEIGIKHPKSKVLLDYLSSVTYWGIPTTQDEQRKQSAYNSIFWEKDSDGKFMLYFSGRGKRFPFTPSSLEENKADILILLEAMYGNTNASMAKKTADEYNEIIGIKDDGEPIIRKWQNYQTYLLDNKYPDGTKREGKDIPLTTAIRPINKENPDDVNRTAIYFYTNEDIDKFIPTEPITPDPSALLKPNLKKAEVKRAEKGKIVMDGKTMNTYTSASGLEIDFTVEEDVDKSNYRDKITVYPREGSTDLQTALNAIKAKFAANPENA